MNNPPPSRRIVLVTGASSGIGRAAVSALAVDNHVVALARSSDALEALDDQVTASTGSGLTLLPLDLGDGDAIDRLAGVFLERFGRLDALLAMAGVLGPIGPLQTVLPHEFSHTIAINLTANWRLIRALDPLLRAGPHGRAIFASSGIVARPRAYWGNYAASKAGLDAMIIAYADETASVPLCVNLYDPGATRTPMRRKAMPGEDPETLPTAEEVAAPLVHYLSPACLLHGQRIIFRELDAHGGRRS